MIRALRLCVLVASTLVVTALAAAPASAGITVLEEERPGDENHACSELVVNVHAAADGCHIVMVSNGPVIMTAHTGASEVAVSVCLASVELRVQTNGSGFLTEQFLSDDQPGSCTRRPCDEPGGAMPKLLWPAVIEDAGTTSGIETTLCLRTLAAEGAIGINCNLHIPIVDHGGHSYTATTTTLPEAEALCEGTPGFGLIGALVTVGAPDERIEIVND